MEIARDLVSTALLLRNQAGINVRRPLARLQLVVPPTVATTDVEQVRALVLEELNVRALQLQDTPGELVRYAVRPNFRKLGPVLGRNMQALARQLSDLDDADVHHFMDVGTLTVSLDGADFELKRADLEVQVRPQRQDLHVARTAQGIVVALDTRIDDELLASGLARESINRIQNMRKRNAFELTDRIRVEYKTSGKLAEAMHRHEAWIRRETLAYRLCPSEAPSGAYRERFIIDREPLELAITREERH